MPTYLIDQKRLLGIHAQLDPIQYSVGGGTGKAKYGANPAKIANLDCSGYVHYVLYEASEGKIVIGKGPSWVNSGGIRDWAKKKGLKSVDYAQSASALDNILRLGYLPPKKSYGHIWLVLNGRTLESHGSKGVNRRPWNTSVLKNNVTDCFEVATTTVLSPAKYRLASKCKDPEIRKLLDAAIDNDKRINYAEIAEIIASVAADGNMTAQELKDLKTIFEYSKSLRGEAKELLALFIAFGPTILGSETDAAPKPKKGSKAKSASQKADEEFYGRHKELKGRPLTNSKADAPLRKEWMQLYRKHGGI